LARSWQQSFKTQQEKVKKAKLPYDSSDKIDEEELQRQPSFSKKPQKSTKMFTCRKYGKEKTTNCDQHNNEQEGKPNEAEKLEEEPELSRFNKLESTAVLTQKRLAEQTPKTKK